MSGCSGPCVLPTGLADTVDMFSAHTREVHLAISGAHVTNGPRCSLRAALVSSRCPAIAAFHTFELRAAPCPSPICTATTYAAAALRLATPDATCRAHKLSRLPMSMTKMVNGWAHPRFSLACAGRPQRIHRFAPLLKSEDPPQQWSQC